jgi:hypothetical protein
MATQVQYRRGTNAQNAAFTGALAEITVDTTNGTLRVHDGITAGGSNIATVAYVASQISSLSANAIVFGTSNVQIPSSGSNVRVNVGGTSNVAVFSTTGANVTGTLGVTGNITGGNLSGTSIVGTLTTAAQTNITSVGTLGSLTVTGNISGGNILGGANVNATTHTGSTVNVTGNISGGNVSGTRGAFTNVAGTLETAAQTNITSVGTLGALTVTGNITFGGSLVDTAALEIVTGSNGNITLSPNGTGVIVANKDIRNGQANGVGNIGTVGGFFNTIFAKATSAQYADLAEMYVADAEYDPGTVVEFGGTHEITISTQSHSTAVAGIISTNPSYLMNSTQTGDYVLPVALTGRVPCRVQGPVKKGDVLVASSTPGVAQRIGMNWQPGCVVGKSMEVIDTAEIRTIEVAVGRL